MNIFYFFLQLYTSLKRIATEIQALIFYLITLAKYFLFEITPTIYATIVN